MMRHLRAQSREIAYELVQTGRKSLELRWSGDSLKLFAPMGVRLRDADRFVWERIGWIDEARERMREYQDRHALEHPMSDGATVLLEGRVFSLRIEQGERARIAQEEGALVVRAPDVRAEKIREQVRTYLIGCARAAIEAQLERYIPLIGRAPGRVTIREQRTRWGSCSNSGNLNFNWKLVMAPPQALEYVVIHELCHLFEFNHSAKFWERVARYQPDYSDWKKWLKENGRILGV